MKQVIMPGLLGALLLGGCQTPETKPAVEADATRELRELREQNQKLHRQMADLDTRVSLLAEKVDRAIPKKPPELDVVHLVPPQPTPEYEAELDEYDPAGDGDLTSEGNRDQGGEPIVLRLYGDGRTRPPRTLPPRTKAVKKLYESARQLYQGGKFSEAAQGVELIAREHPRHDLADNSVYWRGMCSRQLGDHAKAIDLLQQVPVLYPRSPKVPDALLAIGESYLILKDQVSARVFLTQVVEQFGSSEAAGKAGTLLKQHATGGP